VVAGVVWAAFAALAWVAAHIGLVIGFALVVSLISGGITSHYCKTTVTVTHRH
jgi:hypothetical protein